MKRLINLIIAIEFCVGFVSGQEFDLTFSATESGNQTHYARNSITLGPGYVYNPNSGSLTIGIQNPVVNGSVSYGYTINPETRALNTSTYFVGATNGSFNVNPIGGASYSIPLEVPPGVNGLAPGLSIVYSSNSGPGLVGYGWQLGGISLIGRGPKTVFHDGVAMGIELDTTDRFYLDGQRLVNTSGYYYNYPSISYQTGIDIFSRVTPKDMVTYKEGPTWFFAETKSGLQYEYGHTSASQQRNTGSPSVLVNWYVSKITDLFGNQINYSYIQDNGNVYPVEIKYGFNNCNVITFYYKEKYDKNTSYLKGTKFEQWLVLDKITMSYNSNILKTYEFKYNYLGSNYNSYSVLNEIVEYGIGTSRYNSTAISYQIPENVAFTKVVDNQDVYRLTYTSRLYSGDFNGDGLDDIFCIPAAPEQGWRLFKNQGNNSFPGFLFGDFTIDETNIEQVYVFDINGDNYDDVIFTIGNFSSRNYYYALSNGFTVGSCNNFATLGGNLFTIAKTDKSNIGDIDGDGFNDFLTLKSTGELRAYSFNYTNGQVNPISLKFPPLYLGVSVDLDDKVFMADFNGDGMADIWYLNGSGIKIYSIKGGSLNQLYSSTLPTRDHVFNIGDYNGDGKTDMFVYGTETLDWTTWQINLSTGIIFETISIPRKKTNLKDDRLRVGDFNGDGSSDLMVTSKTSGGWTGHYYYISKSMGKDFYAHFYSSGEPGTNRYIMGDYNGDGRFDYLCTDGEEPWTHGYKIYNAPGKTKYLMEKVANGLGFLTKLTYTKLSQATNSVYQRGTGAQFPVTDFQAPISVVSSVQYDNGIGSMNMQNYYYEGLKIHRQGKGFLCFSKTKINDTESSIITETNNSYNSTYFFPQLISTSKKVDGKPDPFESVTNTWSQKVLDPNKKRIFPFVQSSIQSNALTGHSVTTSNDFDDYYGNNIENSISYNNGPTVTTNHTYDNTVSPTKWLLGRPTATTIQYAKAGSTITRSGERVFNANNNHLLSETWYNDTDLQITNSYGYFPNGTLNQETVTTNSISRSTQYTYETNGIRVQTITDPLSHTTTNTYDPYGRLSAQVDYLTTNTITYTYDNLHRQTGISGNDGTGANTLYSWQNPTSTPLLARYSIQTTSNDGSQSIVWYDKLGREIRSDVKGFNGTMVLTSTEYNTKGQVYRVSEPYFPSETAQWNVFTYNDDYGRKTGLTTPSGRNSTWQYTNNTVTETTAGKTFSKTFASDGTLTSATDAGGTITYAYTPDGKINSITAPGNIITSMVYDNAGNQTQLNDPSAGVINYTYNGFGELLTQVSDRDKITEFTYHPDGRPDQKQLTSDGITFTYGYNANKQLTSITSTNNVNRSIGYDPKGRISSITESIPGSSSFTTGFTYDGYGRLGTITHPSGITETKNFNTNGYLAAVSVNGTTYWETTVVNSRGQTKSGRFGTSPNYLNYNAEFDDYGYPETVTTGSLQSYQYVFNPETGNLNSRQNLFGTNTDESFEYDNLDRLDRVYRESTTLLDMAYDLNKGGITLKSDVGTAIYDPQTHPYSISEVNPSTGLMPNVDQDIDYTSFESVSSITQGIYNAAFTYNSDDERAKMVVTENGTPILTRWYPSGNYIKETSGSDTKEYTFIGGDAYTAPVVAIKQNGGSSVFYYILRDHLGSITHVVSASNNSLAAEYSYDAWGRMRDPGTWVDFLPSSEPNLMIAGRGYTGHEHLPWFNLINMNGRVYDPLLGQFLSPDNNIQMPDFTQNFNRYSYALNNPLIYTDPSGEFWDIWLIAGIIGGVSNVIRNWDDIDGNFIKFNQYAFVGCVAGSTAAAMIESGEGALGAGSVAGGIINLGNAYIRGADFNNCLQATVGGSLSGGVTGLAMMGLGAGVENFMKLPSWMSDYSGIEQGHNEISLGKAFLRIFGEKAGNYIAAHGIENAEVILASSELFTRMHFEYGISKYTRRPTMKVTVTGNYSAYNFVQTFTSSDYKHNPNLDGGMADMGRGFFRNPNIIDKEGVNQWIFDDNPWHGSSIDYIWKAELTIVGRLGTSWHPIKTVSWGFKIHNGKIKMLSSKPEVLRNPSGFHRDWVNRACFLHSGTFL